MPRPTNTTERKGQIVVGLMRMMAERGYEKATIQAIASEAGLTPGLVHYHFKSKQEILLALVEGFGDALRERLAEFAKANGLDPRSRLFSLIDALLATGEGEDPNAVACWAMIGVEAVRQKEVRALYQDVLSQSLARVEELMREVLQNEGRATQDVRACAAALLAAVEGYFRLAAGAPDCIPKGSTARSVHAMAVGLIEDQPLIGAKG